MAVDDGWLPLTAAQQGLFFAHQLDPTNPAYTTAEVVELAGELDPARLAAALTAAYAEFEQLRVTFTVTPDGPRQRVRTIEPVRLVPVTVDDAGAAQAWLDTELMRPFDLLAGEVTRTGLVQLPEGTCWWWHAAHHVVLDGYGAQQLLRRVAQLYDGMPPIGAIRLADLVAEDRRAPESEAYWDGRLAPMTGPVSLAGRIATPAPRALRRAIDLPDDLQAGLVQGARRLGASWSELVIAAAGAYVGRILGVGGTRVGVPLMNRALPGVGQLLAARTVCTAMNVLPVQAAASGTIAEALAASRAEQDEVRRHPFERQEWLARRLSRRTGADLFGMQVNLIPLEIDLRLGAVEGTVRNLTAGPVEDLTLTLRGTPGRGRRVRLELDAHPDLYDAAELDLHLTRLCHWLAVWAGGDPDADVARLPLLPAVERELVTTGFNATQVPRGAATLGRRFVDQAMRTPDAVALHYAGQSRTYAELFDRSQRIANGLRDKGVCPGDVVGVRLSRGFGLYETVHAIVLLGAVYLPLDPDLPDSRIAMMMQDADVALVVDDPEAVVSAEPLLAPVPDDVDTPAYLLFTSGSTGRPKGVLVGHRAIDNRLAWMQDHFALAADERVLHKTPISFDVSIWELFWPLQAGASVVIAEPGAHRDPRTLARLIAENDVAVLHFVPSMLRAFLADRVSRSTLSGARVRAVVTSGEALTADLVAGSLECFGIAPTNLYGPTEAAVDVTVWDCTTDDATDGRGVPIGRPVWNTSCFVLDTAGEPVGVGVAGELWLGGVQLAEGYFGRPDLTAERFVQTRWGRLYRTGDLATWRPDGALRYLGRSDDQVKIRGQRIELGEIEAVLAPIAPVAAGAVNGQLVVWFVAEDEQQLSTTLRERAAAVLPPAFLPSHWVVVDELPLGTSGKIDRRRLAVIAPPTAGGIDSGSAPGDLLEQRIAALIADVLGLDAIPADGDFFAFGGDSLSVLRVIGRLEDELGITVGLADAFAHPTACGLARLAGAAVESRDDFTEVLTLRPGGERPPLIVLPPAGGLGWCYTALLPGLPADLGVHAIQAPGIGTGAPEPVADLTALARRQLAAIRSVVGAGPFHLAGWSLGGMAAHAVAALARAEGQHVGAVVLLDAYPAEQWQDLAEPTEAEALIGVLRLAGLDAPDSDMTRAEVTDLLRRSGSALAALPAPLLDGCIASVVEATRLVRTAPPAVLTGDLTVITAAAPRPETHLDPAGWRAHVSGDLRVVPIEATHAQLVRRPVSAQVARLIVEAIEAS